MTANLFHACMKHILAPLKETGIYSVKMTTSNRNVHQCHSIFATFVGEYSEQILVTCLKSSDCPTCPTPCDEMGNGDVKDPQDLMLILETLDAANSHLMEFAQACLMQGSSLFSIHSGKTFHTSTYFVPSPLISFTNSTRGSSNT